MASRKSVRATAMVREGAAPPEEHHFKPGRSGNPKGRPRKEQILGSALREVLGEELEVMERGRAVRMTCRRALAKQVVRKALQTGDTKLIRLLFEVDQSEPQAEANADLRAQQDAEAYKAVIAAFKPAAPPAAPQDPAAQDKMSAAVEPSQDCDADEQLLLPFPED